MSTAADQHLFRLFATRQLPKSDWDHRAHLIVCRVSLARFGLEGARTYLRGAISAFNEATGLRNTDTAGYHETITTYYVHAVHMAASATDPDVVDHPACTREAPLQHWSRARLFSPSARREWVAPDLAAIAWWPVDAP